jgi:hypothetical protein
MTDLRSSTTAIVSVLDSCYSAALNGLPGQETVQQLAADYLAEAGSLEEKIDRLIRWQTMKCATSGFLSGLGGLLTLPVSIPVDLAACLFIQIRMIGAIAVMRGYDLENDKVRTLFYLCLCGDSGRELFKDLGIQFGTRITKSMIQQLSGATVTKINQAVGFRLLTKFGEKGVLNLGKAIPLVGGVIGAAKRAFPVKLPGDDTIDVPAA